MNFVARLSTSVPIARRCRRLKPRNTDMYKRHQELLRQKHDLERKVQILKMIADSIIHSSVSYPNEQGRDFKQYQTSMIDQPPLSDSRHSHRSCSPKLQTNKNRFDDTYENTQAYLNNCESASGTKLVNGRKIPDKQLPPDGRNMPQQKGGHTFGGTREQKCNPDNSQNLHISPKSANSSFGNERRDLVMPTGSVNLWCIHEDEGLAPTNQAMIMSSGSVVPPGRPFQMNHTQDGVLAPTSQAMSMSSESVVPPGRPFEMNHTQGGVLGPISQALTMSSGSVVPPGRPFEMNHTQGGILGPISQALTMSSGSVVPLWRLFEMNHTQGGILGPISQALTMSSGSVVPPGRPFEMNHTQDGVLGPINQALTMSSGSVAPLGGPFEMNHTQKDVLEYIQNPSRDCSLFAPGNLDDIMDIICKDNQPLNSLWQDQENLPSISTNYSVINSSSRSAAVHCRPNTIRRKPTVVTPQACIKPHTTKPKAKISVHIEDDVVEKGHKKQEPVDADSVNVLRQKVECLTIEDMRK